MGRSQAMYVLYQTVATGHQLNIHLLEDPREAWECLKPTITHSTVDEVVVEIMDTRMVDFASPMMFLQCLQVLQNKIDSVPGGDDLWSEQQTMRLFITQLRGEKYFSFRSSLYTSQVKEEVSDGKMEDGDGQAASSSARQLLTAQSYLSGVTLRPKSLIELSKMLQAYMLAMGLTRRNPDGVRPSPGRLLFSVPRAKVYIRNLDGHIGLE